MSWSAEIFFGLNLLWGGGITILRNFAGGRRVVDKLVRKFESGGLVGKMDGR